MAKNGKNSSLGRTKEIKNGGTEAQSECVLFMFAFLGSNYLIDNIFMVKGILPVGAGGKDLLSFLCYHLLFK